MTERVISLTALRSKLLRIAVASLVLLAGAFYTHHTASAASEVGGQSLVDESVSALRHFRKGSIRETVDALLRGAKAVMIFPDVVKGGFIFAAEGGSGLLSTQDSDGSWSDPAFYRLGSGSFGFQAGVSETRMLLIIMTDGALEKMIAGGGKVGIDASAVAITEGLDAEISTTATRSDIYYYAQTKAGLYAGVSLEGSGIGVRDKLNRAYYDSSVSPQQIVIDREVSHEGAGTLRRELAEASRR